MITRLKLSTIEQGLPKYRSMLAGNAAYVPSSYESIASATGTGSSGTITFSSIPSTYQHLQIRGMARSGETAAGTNMNLRFNSDTGSNYAHHRLLGDGTAASAGGSATQTEILLMSAYAANAPANTLSVYIIDIHDYASTTKYKTIRNFSGRNSNDNQSEFVYLTSGLWQNTNAVTSITLFLNSNNFTTQTTFALYGIKGA